MSMADAEEGSRPAAGFQKKDGSTFHTPSFGDEDFDLPPLALPIEADIGNSGDAQQPFSHQMMSGMDISDISPSLAPSMHCAPASAIQGHNPVVPKFPPQNFDVPDINVTNSVMSNVSGNIFSSIAASTGTMFDDMLPDTSLSTISQTQMANQLGFSTALHGMSPMHVTMTTSPPMSNSTSSPSRESSEESDDSVPLSKLMSLKRTVASPVLLMNAVPSQRQRMTTTQTTTKTGPAAKKQKTPKKKKKKDPNEPQKPVSAYALFFRDTQAAIKGQSPNKTFGDVSKIVASMWDSLEPDNKNIYKKKTEVAKKEYLKQLAAYRASQVSQTPAEEINPRSEKSPSPPVHTMTSSGPPPVGGNSMGMMMQMNMPSPPTQPLMNTGGYSSPPHQPMQQLQNIPQHQQQQHQPQQHLTPIHHNNGMTYQRSPDYSQNISHVDTRMSRHCLCVRNGCGNQAIDNPGWDSEYCSNECVVNHCRDIFTAWVASKQGGNPFQVK